MQRVLREMMLDRGCSPAPLPEDTGPGVEMLWTDPQGSHIVVFVLCKASGTEQVSVKAMRQCRDWMDEHSVKHALVVSPCGLNHYTLKETRAWPADIIVEIFLVRELQFNATKTCYHCPHRLVTSAEERAQLMQRYGGPACMMTVPNTDVVVRYFGWRPGDLLAITKTYGGFEGLEDYRIVTDETCV